MMSGRQRRKYRVRSSVVKNNKSKRHRIVVSRSNKNTYLQLIDVSGNVLTSFSTLNHDFLPGTSGLKKSEIIGKEFARACLANGVKKVVFDKSYYSYTGRIKVIADSCRESGLEF